MSLQEYLEITEPSWFCSDTVVLLSQEQVFKVSQDVSVHLY